MAGSTFFALSSVIVFRLFGAPIQLAVLSNPIFWAGMICNGIVSIVLLKDRRESEIDKV